MYYHKITIGFNWWMLVAPLAVFAVYIFGLTKYKYDEQNNTVMKRGGGDFLLKTVVVMLNTVVHGMILLESGAGMLQLVANCIPTDTNIAWAPIILGGEFLILYILFYNALFSIGKFAESRKRQQVFRMRYKRMKENNSAGRDPKEGIVINL